MTTLTATSKSKRRVAEKPAKAEMIVFENKAFDQKRADQLHAKRHLLFQTLSLPKGYKSTSDLISKLRESGYR